MNKFQRRNYLAQQRAKKLESLMERHNMEGGSNRSPYLSVRLQIFYTLEKVGYPSLYYAATLKIKNFERKI